jgi:hypothetical protein
MMAYVSVCFDNYALGLHPEWRASNPQGDPHKTGPFYNASICSPYTDFVLRQIEELAQKYDVDGFWLDIIPLARDVGQELWMIASNPVPDCSLHAHKRFREVTGRGLPRNPTETEADEIFEFMTGEVDRFLKRAYQTIRKHRPNAVITYNAAGAPGDPIDSADLISIEGHAPHYSRQSFIARWAKGQPKPFEMMTAGALPRREPGAGWNGFDQKPETLLRLEASIALAHGGSTLIGQTPYPDGETDPAQFDGLGKVFRPIRDIEPWARGATGVADIGLILASKPRSASREWGRMKEGAEAFHQALLDEHIQYDIVRLTEDLSRYQGLILAEQTALSEAEVTALRAYVQNGGRLLATAGSSLVDERGAKRPEFALADVFGVRYSGPLPADFVYLRLKEDDLKSAVTALPILVDQHALLVTPTAARVLADLVEPESLRTDATTILWGDAPPDAALSHPGLSINTFGKGTCWYLPVPLRAGGMPNVWVKRLMRVLARNLVPEPKLTSSAPPGVEVTLNRQGARLVLHLVNYHAGDTDRLSFGQNGTILRGITIDLHLKRLGLTKVNRVFAAPKGDLRFAVTDEWLRIDAPDLSIHSVIVIE